ncbi:hypothetical protein, partial [Phocaeicola sp.]|uniref:hypothetical protein n=1 Tax=Phocaeicola sp. TaxID=2773926 RepID=UPI003A8E0655
CRFVTRRYIMTSTVQTEMFTIKVTKHTKPNAIFISLHICAIIPQSVILIDKSAVKKGGSRSPM